MRERWNRRRKKEVELRPVKERLSHNIAEKEDFIYMMFFLQQTCSVKVFLKKHVMTQSSSCLWTFIWHTWFHTNDRIVTPAESTDLLNLVKCKKTNKKKQQWTYETHLDPKANTIGHKYRKYIYFLI